MFQFKENMIYTGKSERLSKSGNKYTLVSYLGNEGQTFSTIAECPVPDIKQLQEVVVTFKVTPGRYLSLKTIGMEI